MVLELGYISELLQALILAILPVLAVFAVRWLMSQEKVLMAQLTVEQQTVIRNVVTLAVLAAEQFGLVAKAKGVYFEKKQWALEFAMKRLEKIGLSVDVDYISDVIEAAVLDEFNRFKDDVLRYIPAMPEPTSALEEKG